MVALYTMGGGIVGALLAAIPGLVDLVSLPPGPRRTALTHMALNLSIVLAIACCIAVWVFLWHTPWGYALRTMGHNPEAAIYAGTNLKHMTMLAMCLSGALAGFVGVNELMGVHHRIVLDFPAGYGFAGIAVALMGRSHPLGILLAALLFGALQQGGAELAFEIPTITREMVVVIQGLIILFSGALMLGDLAQREKEGREQLAAAVAEADRLLPGGWRWDDLQKRRPPVPPEQNSSKRADYQRAMGACLEGRGYSVK